MNEVKLPRPAPREDFRKRLRADLMNEAVALAEERRSRRSPGARLAGFWSAGRRPVVVAAALLVLLLGGTGAAAAGSLPGDPAYGLKRAAEHIELALASTSEARVRVLAAQAQRRLDELARAAERSDKAPTASAEYEAAVERFREAVEALRAAEPQEKREAVEELVEAARDKHVPVLEQLKERVPEAAQRGIERALEEHRKLAPAGVPGERPGKPSEQPRVTESPRGGRPSVLPTPRRP